jgi:radical SAM protein with 4Fe4S-binding SPASM domain
MKLDKNIICMMPWIHAHIWPSGDVYPCCMSDSKEIFGNTNMNTIEEIVNNDKFKKIRLEMIGGTKPSACSRCYELEETADSWTLRKNSLRQYYDRHGESIKNTNSDGSINDFKMVYMDIRFSNLCNMKCRSCGPSLSSSWYEDSKLLGGATGHPKFLDVSSNPNFMADLKQYLDDVEEVYFAGGEALITPHHYDVLDYWLSIDKTDVKLRYTTNFSALKYKQRHIFDYWSKFSDIRVAASLDAMWERGEYVRSGTNWNTIIKNRKLMIERFPEMYFEITPTVSVFNVKHLFDFHRTWVEQDLLNIDNIRVNLLTWPREYSITIFDDQEKQKITKIYQDYIAWLIKNGARVDTVKSISGIVDYMMSNDHSDHKSVFKNKNSKVDSVRTESFTGVFPELKEWYDR